MSEIEKNIGMMLQANSLEEASQYQQLALEGITALRGQLAAAEAERDALREALGYLLQVVEASPYGGDRLHHITCFQPHGGQCNCGVYQALDMARNIMSQQEEK